ncbi:hypothetical protein [Virgibacillus sp. CBA3643]|uniref:hypothetical protein n=1 Tax=Virgibacillus sp. CBA3643 TaxID=2942278 RepID=UPI0035A32E7C
MGNNVGDLYVHLSTDVEDYASWATTIDCTIGKTTAGDLEIEGRVDYTLHLLHWHNDSSWEVWRIHNGYFNNVAYPVFDLEDWFSYGSYKIGVYLNYDLPQSTIRDKYLETRAFTYGVYS